jgi:hypothetical protein
MADIATPIAAVAASSIAYPMAVAVGLPSPLALPVAVAAAGGASWAMSNRERIEIWTVGAIFKTLIAWAFSWLFGAIFGPIAANITMAWVPGDYAQVVQVGAVAVGYALVLSAVGISHILPLALRQLDQRAQTPGGQ